jgi:16S rRNA (uracil1498-N3)-methyltransferase
LDPGVEILLGQGIPKGKKFETVLQKATELGVGSIFPLFCERSIVQFREKRIQHDMQRWQNIVIEASQQSQRLAPPSLSQPCSLELFLENHLDFDLGLLLYEKEKKTGIRSYLRKKPIQKKVLILIGPEGGFSEKEVEGVVNKGFVSVSLGERVLRTETVGPFLVGLLQYEWGDIP